MPFTNFTNKKGTLRVPLVRARIQFQCVRVTANCANCSKKSRYCVDGIESSAEQAARTSASACRRV